MYINAWKHFLWQPVPDQCPTIGGKPWPAPDGPRWLNVGQGAPANDVIVVMQESCGAVSAAPGWSRAFTQADGGFTAAMELRLEFYCDPQSCMGGGNIKPGYRCVDNQLIVCCPLKLMRNYVTVG